MMSDDKRLFRPYGTHQVTAAAHRQKQSNRVGTKHSELISNHSLTGIKGKQKQFLLHMVKFHTTSKIAF